MPPTTLDPAEVAQFEALSAKWWDPKGPFAPLHRFTPVRMDYFRSRLTRHFGLPRDAAQPLTGLRVLDIGCGGGLIAEPLYRLGAAVTAVDAAAGAIDAACTHAELNHLNINYRCMTAEALAAEGTRFDVVVASEVLEHVASLHVFCAAVASLLKPEGAFLATTINRTTRALLGAKLAAEYILRWAPVGTHDWRKFVRPDELRSALGGNGLVVRDFAGLRFRPLTNSFEISGDTSINYGCLASHREGKKTYEQLS